ncbi:MAG: hypothetical protein ABGW87_02110 [Sphingomonadaceae bacterium]
MYDPTRRASLGSAFGPGQGDNSDPAREWLAHVEAGRIGRRPKMTREHLRTHVRNELLVLGYRTFPLDDD